MTTEADIERPGETATDPVEEPDDGRIATLVGGGLIALVVAAALFFRWRPGPIFLDHWGFSFIHPAIGNWFYNKVTQLHSLSIVVASSILSALVVFRRDKLRSLACLVGPLAAIVIVEWFLKPVIARRYAQVLSFPSGTTSVVTAMATGWALAVPRRIRPFVVILGAFIVGLECISVIALQWHFPTDALGGVMLGVGVVLLIDGSLHLVFRPRSAVDDPPVVGPAGSGPQSGTGLTDAAPS